MRLSTLWASGYSVLLGLTRLLSLVKVADESIVTLRRVGACTARELGSGKLARVRQYSTMISVYSIGLADEPNLTGSFRVFRHSPTNYACFTQRNLIV